jgi:hypothetical protein
MDGWRRLSVEKRLKRDASPRDRWQRDPDRQWRMRIMLGALRRLEKELPERRGFSRARAAEDSDASLWRESQRFGKAIRDGRLTYAHRRGERPIGLISLGAALQRQGDWMHTETRFRDGQGRCAVLRERAFEVT